MLSLWNSRPDFRAAKPGRVVAVARRFATLRDAIPDITDRMLSDRLQELEQEGIVDRTVVPETPVRVEYSLTKKGRALAAAMDAIADWAEKWIDQQPPACESAPARARRRA